MLLYASRSLLQKAPWFFHDVFRNELDSARLYDQSLRSWLAEHQDPQEIEAFAQWQRLTDFSVPNTDWSDAQGRTAQSVRQMEASTALEKLAGQGSVLATYFGGLQIFHCIFAQQPLHLALPLLTLASDRGLCAATARRMELLAVLPGQEARKQLNECVEQALACGDELCLLVAGQLQANAVLRDNKELCDRIRARLVDAALKGNEQALHLLLKTIEAFYAGLTGAQEAAIFKMLEQRAEADDGAAHTLLGLVKSHALEQFLMERENRFAEHVPFGEADPSREQEDVSHQDFPDCWFWDDEASEHFARARDLGDPWALFLDACICLDWRKGMFDEDDEDEDREQREKDVAQALKTLEYLADTCHFAPAMSRLGGWLFENNQDSDRVCTLLRTAALAGDNTTCLQTYADYLWCKYEKLKYQDTPTEKVLEVLEANHSSILTLFRDKLPDPMIWEVLAEEVGSLASAGFSPVTEVQMRIAMLDKRDVARSLLVLCLDMLLRQGADAGFVLASEFAALRPDLPLDSDLLEQRTAFAGRSNSRVASAWIAIRSLSMSRWLMGELDEQEQQRASDALYVVKSTCRYTDCLFGRLFLSLLKVPVLTMIGMDPENFSGYGRWPELFADDLDFCAVEADGAGMEYIEQAQMEMTTCIGMAMQSKDLPALTILYEGLYVLYSQDFARESERLARKEGRPVPDMNACLEPFQLLRQMFEGILAKMGIDAGAIQQARGLVPAKPLSRTQAKKRLKQQLARRKKRK